MHTASQAHMVAHRDEEIGEVGPAQWQAQEGDELAVHGKKRGDGLRENHSFLIPVPSHNTLNAASSDDTPSEVEEPLLPAAQSPPRADRVVVGMLWYGASSFFFAGMGICIKLLGQYHYPVMEIMVFRAVIILTCCLSVIVSAGDNPLGNRRGLLLVRGTAGYISITCFFYACQLLPIADATCFTFLGPLVAALFSPLILKERIGAATAVVIPMCIAGLLLITQPSFLFGHDGFATLPLLGVMVGLCQPFFSAGAKMTVRLLRTTEKTNVIVFYLVACTLVYSLVGCAFQWKRLVVPSSAAEFALLLAQGLAGYGNQMCITKGLENAKAASVMCMQYFSIIVSQLGGMLIFREFTTWQADLGMVVVVASMVIYFWWESHTKKREQRAAGR